VASVLLTLHLTAVFAAPWANPPPSSELARLVAAGFYPYLRFMSLDNGYRFFAPDPGPSHLVRYEIELEDGAVHTGRFPELAAHRPRLLYHRYLMIAEILEALTSPNFEIPPQGPLLPEHQAFIFERRRRAELLQQSIARQLAREHPGARRIRLYVVTHALPSPMDVENGMRLDDPALYRERLVGDFASGQL
jgi:hypothetical protein